MGKKRQALWLDGVISFGAELIPDPISFTITRSLQMMSHPQGDGAAPLEFPTGSLVNGAITYHSMTAELFAALTGGTSSTGTIKRIRQGEEEATISTLTITLAEAGDVIPASVRLVGAAGTHFKKVASSPEVGEFSYATDTGVCTFNAAETETTIYPDYLYAESAEGQTVTIDKNDLPAEAKLYGSIRTKDMNAGTLGDIVVELANVNLKGDLVLGGDKSGTTKEFTQEFSARITGQGDWKTYFPA